MKTMKMFCIENRRHRSFVVAVIVLVASLTIALFTTPSQAAIVYINQSSGFNDNLPTDGSAGALTIPQPAGVSAGRALIASIAARPRNMTVTVPTGWVLMTSTQQTAGGVSTAPGGMTLLTYYKIATVAEPASYTWTFANLTLGQGGSAVGGILVFSGIDTSAGSPIDVWSARLTPNGLTHATNSITPTVTNTMIVSSISYLSASSFANPTGIPGITERLDVSAPVTPNAIGTTLQMSTATWATATATGASQAVAASDGDTGVGHLMALKPSLIDLDLSMARSGPLIPGGSASYTLTVINNGINSEPGPLTIVDTLPAGLTYASFSGSGWACGAVGQTVTCTRVGIIAASATAPALTLNVNVSAGATGTLTNTATVSGTGGDGNTANNTAVDSYTIPLQSYAYYAMDETVWGVVTDSSGNGRNGSVLGAAMPTGYPPASPPGSAIAGDPGTCGAGSIPVTAGTQGVNTPIDLNSMGNAGSISFWYNSNTVWNDGNSRMLFDASNELGNGGNFDKHFYLVKEGGGQLRFAFERSDDQNYQARSGGNSFPAGEWHHIAVTWDMGSDRARLYLDGVEVATSNNTSGVLGDTATLYLGDQRFGTIQGAPAYTANSANGYLDEVRLYASALSAAQVTADMTATHPCGSVHHYELSLAASSLTCLPTTVTVTACANASSPCTNPSNAVNGLTADLATTGGSLGSGTVTFNASGVATTTLSYPGAADGTNTTVTLSGEDQSAANPRQCCQGGVCVVANSCTTTFNTAGFIFSGTAGGAAATIPAQTAGVSSSTYFLRAVRTSTTTQACEAALSGANTVNFAYECNNPTTCSSSNLMSVNGGSATTIQRNNNGSPLSYQSVNMTFDANGNAPFTFNYSDVGQVTLHANKPAGGSLLSSLTGASNAFVVKPDHFDLTAIQCTIADAANCAPGALPSGNNPAAANAAGASFIQAGKPFSVTVTARHAGGGATPNYGREISPEGVRLDRNLVPPTGPGNPAVGFTTGFGAFTNGAATGTDFIWNEVGIITLTPGIGDGNYLGAGDVTGTTSVNVGRFIPHHFDVTPVVHGCTGGGAFTYSGQPFGQVTVTAKSTSNTVTNNYNGGFAKNVTLSDANGSTVGTFANGTFNAGGFANGTQFQSNVTYSFTDKETVPLILKLRATEAIGGDGVTSASGGIEDDAPIRSGRVRIINAYGSELGDLPVPMRVEYYNTDGWVANAADTCSTVATLTAGNFQGNLQSGETCVLETVAAGCGTSSLGCAGPASKCYKALPLGGGYNLHWKAPGATNDGSVDVGADLNTLPWLRYDWDNNGSLDNPTGLATFGTYSGSPRHIYIRERY